MSKNFLKINIVLLTILIFSLVPIFVSSAATSSASLNIENPLGATSDISILVSNIITFLWNLSFVIVPILIVYAGYLYLSSAGNEEKVKKAQKALIWALIGFGVILIANGVPAIIQELLSGESTTTTTTNTLPESIQI